MASRLCVEIPGEIHVITGGQQKHYRWPTN